MLPSYSYALISAFLWALSAPIINKGLDKIPNEAKFAGILIGLLASLLSGSLFLLIFLLPHLGLVQFSLFLILAGIFTFPVGTGLYYLCGHAYKGKMEIAAQFARVKPIFSVLLAVLFLKETLSSGSYISLILIGIGTVFIIIGSLQGTFRLSALLLGLLTAGSWSLGEAFIKLGLSAKGSIIDTFVALVSGTIALTIFFILLSPFYSLKKHKCQAASWITYFIAHGVLSFGVAYAAFFESIKVIGLGQTVLINAFWPIFAIFFVWLGSYISAEEYQVPKFIWLAATFLLIGSILQVIIKF